MRIYWYWPNLHEASSSLVRSVAQPGDRVTVHALPSLEGREPERIEEYEVVRTLPDPSRLGTSLFSRVVRPVRLAGLRRRSRSELLGRGFDVAYVGMLFHHTDWFDVPRLRRELPVLSHVHDVLPHQYRLPEIVERRMLVRLYRSAGHLATSHEVMKRQLVEEFDVDPEMVAVLPMALDASMPIAPRPEANSRPTLMFFGRLRANKGVEVFADAVAAIAGDVDADFVIAGGGSRDVTERLRAKLGGFSNVQLELEHISAERRRELFDRASWIVLPYTSFFSQSGVLGDAYQHGVPVIVSDVGAMGATVRDEQTGLVVEPNSAPALAAALDEAVRADRGRFAERVAVARLEHDYTVVGRELRRVLNVVAEGRVGA